MATTLPRSSMHAYTSSFLLLTLAATTSCGAAATDGSCIPAERAALLTFKAGITSDPANLLGTWHGGDCCQWSGINCSSRTGHVVKLDLYNQFFEEDYQGNVASHSLRGQISSSLRSLRHLKHLDLSANKHLGHGMPIPDFVGSLDRLVFLDLSFMNFSGRVPPNLGNLTKLVYLNIFNYYGATHSDISWLPRLRSLQSLELGGVNLSSAVDWFHTVNALPNLVALSLHNCGLNRLSFHGAIPQHLVSLEALTASDKALGPTENPFGEEYQEMLWSSDTGLFNDSLPVVIKGKVLGYRENVIYLMSIDLSCNSLTGRIPEEMSSLAGLINLNLSSNSLSGQIPYKIGNMQSLESLDVSKNQLSGEIPWGLSDLTSLAYLNLSYNDLSGRIPSGHQLDTLQTDDPASMYIGNPGLCGRPVSKQCPGDQPTQGDSVEWHKHGLAQIDFLLSLIVGFVAGVCMVFCSLLFLKKWRYAYFRLFDKLCDKVYVLSVVSWHKWFGNNGEN